MKIKRKGLSLKVRFQIFDRDGFKCRYCGKSPSDGVVLEADHIKPVFNGGQNDIDNLITACWECNHGKGKNSLLNEINLNEADILQETKLQRYIDVLGLDRVRRIASCSFEERDSGSGSHFLDILGRCEYEKEEESILKFIREKHS